MFQLSASTPFDLFQLFALSFLVPWLVLESIFMLRESRGRAGATLALAIFLALVVASLVGDFHALGAPSSFEMIYAAVGAGFALGIALIGGFALYKLLRFMMKVPGPYGLH